jgi:hypothetical protein
LVDEVQYAPALFRHLKVAIDRNRHAMGQFILTGSQKFTLMQSVADSLAGRRLHGKMIAIYGIAFEYKTSAPCGALEPKANPPRPAVAMIGAHRIGHQISPQVADAVTYTMTVRQGTI